MRNNGFVCIGLILAGILLTQPCAAANHSNRALRNLLAATGHARLGTLPTYQTDPATTPNAWNGPPSGLAFIDRALASLNLSEGANYFMQGSRAGGGMALAVTRASYPGRGYMLNLKWQLGQ